MVEGSIRSFLETKSFQAPQCNDSHFSDFFVQKVKCIAHTSWTTDSLGQECLALLYESLHLYQDALEQYDQLERILALYLAQRRTMLIRSSEQPDTLWLLSFGPMCELPCRDGLRPKRQDVSDFRSLVVGREVSIFDMQRYLLDRQVKEQRVPLTCLHPVCRQFCSASCSSLWA